MHVLAVPAHGFCLLKSKWKPLPSESTNDYWRVVRSGFRQRTRRLFMYWHKHNSVTSASRFWHARLEVFGQFTRARESAY